MKKMLSEESVELIQKDNCFDFIRYFFTISIFIVHFFDLTNINQNWFVSGATGVKAFFIISGFLIFYSQIQKQNLKYYIEKRIRRILLLIFRSYFFVLLLVFFLQNLVLQNILYLEIPINI